MNGKKAKKLRRLVDKEQRTPAAKRSMYQRIKRSVDPALLSKAMRSVE